MTDVVESFISRKPKAVRPILEAIAAMIDRETGGWEPRLKVRVPTWGPGRDTFYMDGGSRHAVLGFYFGADLRDPNRLMRGVGMTLRSITIESPEDLEKPEVLELVRKAITMIEQVA